MPTLPIISNVREFTLNANGTKTEVTGTPTALIAKLIKSSIYCANGTLARFTGNYDVNSTPIFSAHGTEIVTGSYTKVTKDDVNTYMGR